MDTIRGKEGNAMNTSNILGIWRIHGVFGDTEIYMGKQGNRWRYVAMNGEP